MFKSIMVKMEELFKMDTVDCRSNGEFLKGVIEVEKGLIEY